MEQPSSVAADSRGARERRPSVSLPVCKDSVRGRCTRLECKFAHPLPSHATHVAEDEREMVTVCNDALRGRCTRGQLCKFFHAPPHMHASLAEQVGIAPAAAAAPAGPHAGLLPGSADLAPSFHLAPYMPAGPMLPPAMPGARPFTRPALEVCRDYVKGRCARESSECRFAHASPSPGEGNKVTVCQDFLKGRCERPSCKYFHPEEHLRRSILDIAVAPALPGAEALDPLGLAAYHSGAYQAYAASLYGAREPSSKKLRTEDGVMGAPGLHDASDLDGGRTRKTSMDMPVAWYGSGMSTAYPGALPPFPTLGYTFPQAIPGPGQGMGGPRGDRVQVCRDFLKNRCSRTPCRFAHPESSVQVVDSSVTVCKDAQRGRCERPQCRFYHPPTEATET